MDEPSLGIRARDAVLAVTIPQGLEADLATGLPQVQLIVDGINKSGGVLGKKLEIVPLDSANNVEKTTEQLRKAIDDGTASRTTSRRPQSSMAE